jgi:hypothetical protein
MSMPRFTAEASLHNTSQVYYGYFGASGLNASLPAVRGQSYFSRCGCWEAFLGCWYGCERTDPGCIPVEGTGLQCECQDDCWTSLGNCEANCTRRLLTLPPSVARPFGP